VLRRERQGARESRRRQPLALSRGRQKSPPCPPPSRPRPPKTTTRPDNDAKPQKPIQRKHKQRAKYNNNPPLHRDAHVGALERGRVVDAVARHAARKALLAERLDDQVLVLGEDAGEAVGLHDHAAVLGAEVLGDLAVLCVFLKLGGWVWRGGRRFFVFVLGGGGGYG